MIRKSRDGSLSTAFKIASTKKDTRNVGSLPSLKPARIAAVSFRLIGFPEIDYDRGRSQKLLGTTAW